MTLYQQIQRSSMTSLERDRAAYEQAIAKARMPDMIPIWQATLDLLNQEIAYRQSPAYQASQTVLPF
ncbi:hypothetical protein GCM10028805_47220 [Spirosoma harenae]